jgi:branched-subunit amino acid aminotransferase/4-amino-4-deoxychorismate lyase
MPQFQWQPTERQCYLINGEITAISELPNSMFNRGFLYSDGFFETIRICHGIPQHMDLHWNRITASLSAHRIQNQQGLTVKKLAHSLIALCTRNGVQNGGRVRITFFRDGGGRYRPESNDMAWLATAEPLTDNLWNSPDKGLSVDVFNDMKKLVGPFANFKNLSSALYIQAALWAEEKALDDALIQNHQSSIIESSHSNLFLVSNRVLYTPSLDSGPVGGIMRASVINAALEHGFKVYECTITPKEMLQADEMFLTNTIRGIQWVASYKTKRYFHETAKVLTQIMNDRTVKKF